MSKDELKLMIKSQINAYEKMIEDNQDRMINLQEQINHFKSTNSKYMDEIRKLSKKLRELE